MIRVLSLAKLSGAAAGNKPIKVTGTDSAGAVTIHTCVSGTDDWDEIALEAWNNSAAYVDLTLELGDSSTTMVVTLEPKAGPKLIPRRFMQNGLVIKAFAGTADVCFVAGVPVAHRSSQS